jgi:hypothetical protein
MEISTERVLEEGILKRISENNVRRGLKKE